MDTYGRMIKVISRGYYEEGSHTINVETADLSAGPYLIREISSYGKNAVVKIFKQ